MYPPEILAAIKAGDTVAVRRWLEEGPRKDLNAVIDVENEDALLHFVLRPIHESNGNRAKLLQLLIANGANIHATTRAGFTALHKCRSPGEASILVDNGAELDARSTRYGITPLMIAARDANVETVRFLLLSGADVFLVDHTGNDAEAFTIMTERRDRGLASRKLFRAVKRAGGWKPYVRAPRIELVRLRSLCARGRATPPRSDPVLQRLFSAPSSSKKATRASKRANRRPLPNEVLWHILGYWRSSREVGA